MLTLNRSLFIGATILMTLPTLAQTSNSNVGNPPKKGDKVAVIKTNYGTIVFKFFPDKAPKSVANFEKLAGSHFYDGTKFHRVIPNFMIQGGDPNSKGSDRSTYGMGGPGWKVPAEFSVIKHVRGIVSMARAQDPDSAGSQFFIMVAAAPSLDGQYSAFGHVIKGMDVVDKIVNLPRDERDDPLSGHEAVLESVRIEKWPLK
jgi:cyclophilin family peptidyl-prolyl cis-trans isomerase